MGKNLYRFWVTLLVVTGGIALWFTTLATSRVWTFVQLNARAPAALTDVQVRELSASSFALEVSYSYQVRGSSYSGKTIFESPRFMNRYAAENHAKHLHAKGWETWYRQSSPRISTLERDFPQKSCLQALLTVGVFAYFYFARKLLETA